MRQGHKCHIQQKALDSTIPPNNPSILALNPAKTTFPSIHSHGLQRILKQFKVLNYAKKGSPFPGIEGASRELLPPPPSLGRD